MYIIKKKRFDVSKISKTGKITMFHFIISLSLLFLSAHVSSSSSSSSSKPNIVFFLTDDQDQMLGGSFPTVGEATPVRVETRSLMHNRTIQQKKYQHSKSNRCQKRND